VTTTPAPKLPTDVLVSGQVWEIHEVGELLAHEGEWGETHSSRGRIQMDRLAPQPRTVFHELLHAANQGIETTLDHDTLAALASGLADAMLSRPVLAEWIAARARGEDR
jgi:hypothetical protein